MTEPEFFGVLPDGRAVQQVRIAAGGLSARILTWGAVVRDLRLEGAPHPLTLGYERIGDYLDHGAHFGAVAGRCANRIAHGRFTLDGAAHQLELKPGAAHHLHGGDAAQFGRRPWEIAALTPDSVTLTLRSPDGDGGYPGAVAATCVYRLAPPATLVVALSAVTDAPTLVNLAHHSYFNLDGDADVRGHRLTVAADRYTPTDEDLIPLGVAPVDGTPFDFRAGRLVGAPDAPPYDVNLCLADARAPEPRFAARLEGARGVAMEVWTTEPGVQFFNAPRMAIPVAGLEGRRYGAQAGLCLEPQVWPDAINHSDFPSAVLRPGETYRQRSEFRFTASG